MIVIDSMLLFTSLCFVGVSCFMYGVCIYLRIPVSNKISMCDDVRVSNINTTGVNSGAGTANPSGALEFTLGFIGVRFVHSLVSCVVFSR